MRHVAFRRVAVPLACAVAAFVAQSVPAASPSGQGLAPRLGVGGTIQIALRSPQGRIVRTYRRALVPGRTLQASGRGTSAPVLNVDYFAPFFADVNPFYWVLTVRTTFPDSPAGGGQVVTLTQVGKAGATAPFLAVRPHLVPGEPLTFTGSFTVSDPQSGSNPGTIGSVDLTAYRGSGYGLPEAGRNVSGPNDTTAMGLLSLVRWGNTGIHPEVGQQVLMKISITFSVAQAPTATTPQ